MLQDQPAHGANHGAERNAADHGFAPAPIPDAAVDELDRLAADRGGPYVPPPEVAGAVGFTHFDASGSEDDHLVVLLTAEHIERLPRQSLVRIKSLADRERGLPARDYLGVVTAGPFAEPDGLKADSSIVVATTTQGKGRVLLPRYHGRTAVQILGEEIKDEGGGATPVAPAAPGAPGAIPKPTRTIPHRYRPRPNSPVFPLTREETAAVLHVEGDARLGVMVGRGDLEVGIRTDSKMGLPRHTGIVGTTGGGKSTTVARLVHQLQKAGAAVVLFDVEGEYTELDLPTEDPAMLAALAARGLAPEGVADLRVHHLVGRETGRTVPRGHGTGSVNPFRLDFADLSPHAVTEILGLTEAQQARFFKAYDALKLLMKDLQIFPRPGDEGDHQRLMELDELETGYPEMTLLMLRDVVNVCFDYADRAEGTGRKKGAEDFDLSRPIYAPQLRGQGDRIKQIVARTRPPGSIPSWASLLGKLNQLARLKVFDNPKAAPLDPATLIHPGRVSVIDLSDTDAPAVNNLVIATLLRHLQAQQEREFHDAEAQGRRPTPTVIVIEEAHEFLSAERIKQMPTLFDQVAKIAKRGRKRWLGLVFVTQLPQHLPDEVIGLINNWVVHKIADANVIDRLRKSIAGLDRGQWSAVPALAAGQAVVSLTTGARPVLTAIDAAPCRLRMVE